MESRQASKQAHNQPISDVLWGRQVRDTFDSYSSETCASCTWLPAIQWAGGQNIDQQYTWTGCVTDLCWWQVYACMHVMNVYYITLSWLSGIMYTARLHWLLNSGFGVLVPTWHSLNKWKVCMEKYTFCKNSAVLVWWPLRISMPGWWKDQRKARNDQLMWKVWSNNTTHIVWLFCACIST